MKEVNVKYLPLIKEKDSQLYQLLQITLKACDGPVNNELTIRMVAQENIEERKIPLYSKADKRWVYREFVPVSKTNDAKEVTVEILLQCGNTWQTTCIQQLPTWREICFVPITHHDLGYTQTIDKLLEDYCQYYCDILDFCDVTADFPEEAQYRYTVEQFWSLEYFLAHTTPENVERFKSYVRNGRIEITATYANIIDSNLNSEEMHRLIASAKKFTEECGVTIKSAAQVDMPGLSSATIRTLCEADIRYFFAGFPQYFGWSDFGMTACDGRMPDMKRSYWNEKELCSWGHPFACYWKPDAENEKSIFSWYQFGYGWFSNEHEWTETTDSYEEIELKLPEFLSELSEKGYPYPLMRYIDNGSDNQRPKIGISHYVKKWNETYAWPKLSIATNTMFFEKMEQLIPSSEMITLCGEMPHTDYSIAALSEAEHNTLNARTRTQLVDAEKMHSVAMLYEYANEEELLHQDMEKAWRDVMLFDEHCYGMAAVTGARFRHNRGLKLQYALRGAMRSQELYSKAYEAIYCNAKHEDGVVTVFNPAGCEAPGIIRFFGSGINGGEYLQDEVTGICYPLQNETVTEAGLPYPNYDDQYHITRLFDDLKETVATVGMLPPLAIRTFRVVKRDKKQEEKHRHDNQSTILLDSLYYEIHVSKNEGKVLLIKDKETGRNLLDTNAITGFGKLLVKNLIDGSYETQEVVCVKKRLEGDVADSILIHSRCEHLPSVITEIVLYKAIKRIDVNVRLSVIPYPISAIWMEFPFLAEAPTFEFGTPNGAIDLANTDNLIPGANTNQITYSGWCGVKEAEHRIVMASPEQNIVSFGDIYPTTVSHAHHFYTEEGYECAYAELQNADNGHLYAMLTYNNAKTNFSPYQSGEVIYRFSFTSGTEVEPTTFAEQVIHASEVFCNIKPNDKKMGDFHIQDNKVIVENLKKMSDGYELRLRNGAGVAVKSTFDLPMSLNCQRITINGDVYEDLGVTDKISLCMKPYETHYYRLHKLPTK